MLIGASFFEFQAQYDKGSTEGSALFGLGSKAITTMPIGQSTFNVWCLYPTVDQKSGTILATEVVGAFGGKGLGHAESLKWALCPEGDRGQKEGDKEGDISPAAATGRDAVGASDYPVTEQHGFLKFTAAGAEPAQVLKAVQAALSTWLAVHPGSLRAKIFSEHVVEATGARKWVVAYRVRLPVLQYAETKRAAFAIKGNSTGFLSTLREELITEGANRARLSATLSLYDFTELQGETPVTLTTSSITRTTTTTATSSTTSTLHWVELSGFISLDSSSATNDEVRTAVVATLKSKLIVFDGQIHEVSIFQSRRLLEAVPLLARFLKSQLEVSYLLRIPDVQVPRVKELARQMSDFTDLFEAELRRQFSFLFPDRTQISLRIAAFSHLQGDTTTSTLQTTDTITITSTATSTTSSTSLTTTSTTVALGPMPTTTAAMVLVNTLFHCEEGYATWRAGWSHEKKKWCCEREKRGCEELAVEDGQDRVGAAAAGITAPIAEASDQGLVFVAASREDKKAKALHYDPYAKQWE
jgi:hypothetical protein